MEIGTKLKTLRLGCGLTQEELAARCDITKGYVSQLENDLTSPSIDTLKDLLSALGTNLKDFFKDEAEERIVFTPEDFFENTTEDMTLTWLVPDSQKNMMEPTLVVLKAGQSTTQDLPHEGEEFGYVLEGSLAINLGKRTVRCGAGSSFYYRCDRIHFISNDGKKDAKLLWISTPPNF